MSKFHSWWLPANTLFLWTVSSPHFVRWSSLLPCVQFIIKWIAFGFGATENITISHWLGYVCVGVPLCDAHIQLLRRSGNDFAFQLNIFTITRILVDLARSMCCGCARHALTHTWQSQCTDIAASGYWPYLDDTSAFGTISAHKINWTIEQLGNKRIRISSKDAAYPTRDVIFQALPEEGLLGFLSFVWRTLPHDIFCECNTSWLLGRHIQGLSKLWIIVLT